jgi:3-dehydroquinate synthetase
MTESRAVRVELGDAGYDVLVGQRLLTGLGDLLAPLGARRVHVFEDAGLPRAVRDAAAASLGQARVSRQELRLDETSKSLATLESMLHGLASNQLERTDLVVALGGGILGDVAGLAAGLHRRGVGVVQCPTTLLAMVDASVGGKTGINLSTDIDGRAVMLKNAVGLFHQPAMVVADVGVLSSLPPRDLRSGLAECIKHAVIAQGGSGDGLSLSEIESSIASVIGGDWASAAEFVAQNIALKARVVADDERELARGERPGRRALNLGHTFAHAIEALEATRVEVDGRSVHPTHGEAVGLGLLAACRLAERCGVASGDLGSGVAGALGQAGLPQRLVGGAEPDVLISAMRQDKKSQSGSLRLVLPTPEGVIMMDDPGDAALCDAWRAIL